MNVSREALIRYQTARLRERFPNVDEDTLSDIAADTVDDYGDAAEYDDDPDDEEGWS